MKKFITALFSISILCCIILYKNYNYSAKIIFYHLLVISVVYIFVLFLNCLLAILLKNNRLRNVVSNVFNYVFFSCLFLFYILVIGSNHFWYKTITLRIMKNYTGNLANFLTIIPVQKWIIFTFILLLIIIITLLFLFIRPRTDRIREKILSYSRKEKLPLFLVASGIILLSLFIFKSNILELKRTMQYNEEPALEFLFGNMSGEKNEVAFDRERYEYGKMDQTCIDTLSRHSIKPGRAIVIILIDALRSDHLPMYGYTRNTTPFLDSLYHTNNLRVIKNAFSTSTNTIGGVASLFYSRDWPKVGFNGLNLMKLLKSQGYKTYAYLTGFHRDWYGLSAIYRSSCDFYYESSLNMTTRTDDDLVTLQKLQETTFSENSFIYLHLLSTHLLGTKNPVFQKFTPYKIGIGAGRKESLENNYDNGLLQADFVVRSVFQKLAKDNILDKTTVFILADHGESFGENGDWGHGGNVRGSVIGIPLLIYDQDIGWYNNNEFASLKDVAPTISERINYPVPGCWDGYSMHHAAPLNFELNIHSAENCDHPKGILVKKDTSYLLKIFNVSGEEVSTEEKKPGGWQLNKKGSF